MKDGKTMTKEFKEGAYYLSNKAIKDHFVFKKKLRNSISMMRPSSLELVNHRLNLFRKYDEKLVLIGYQLAKLDLLNLPMLRDDDGKR